MAILCGQTGKQRGVKIIRRTYNNRDSTLKALLVTLLKKKIAVENNLQVYVKFQINKTSLTCQYSDKYEWEHKVMKFT